MNSKQLITHWEQATSEWLTAVLIQSGALTKGQITHVETNCGSGHWSQNVRLLLTYSDDALGECPTRLFLKLVDTNTGDGEFFLPSEVTYYTRDYIDLADAPLVRCYEAPMIPPKIDIICCCTICQKRMLLLMIYSRHWPMGRRWRKRWPFCTLIGGVVTSCDSLVPLSTTRHIYAVLWRWDCRVFLTCRLFLVTVSNRIGLTGYSSFLLSFQTAWQCGPEIQLILRLLHGDPNPGNLLVPKIGERPLYLIDQQPFNWSLTTWLGVYDLAYVMALYWPSDLRRQLEIAILRHYHQTLRVCGVQVYTWEQLVYDYRLSVALMVPVAVEYMRDGGDPDWNAFRYGMIQRTLTACDDLDCQQLFLITYYCSGCLLVQVHCLGMEGLMTLLLPFPSR